MPRIRQWRRARPLLSVFLILVFWLAALPAPRPAVAQLLAPASQDETASPDEAQALERLYLPWLAGPSPRETMTVDHLTLGEGAPTAAQPSPVERTEPKAASALAPAATPGWQTLMHESFEGDFPAGNWRVLDENGKDHGELTWDDDDARAASGQWSAWAANGGADGLDPAKASYANHMRAWMIYGPFSLQQVEAAALHFAYWNRSEQGYDWLGWYASADGVTFHGWRVSGDSGGWRTIDFDLTQTPALGDLTGDASVWIAFVFRSDEGKVDAGPFVDDLLLEVLPTTQGCGDQAKAEYFANATLSGSPALTRCESWPLDHAWGTGSPAASLPADGFSARWSGVRSFASGIYTFTATVDDGVRIWLDDALIIDSWRDQGLTTLTAVRELMAGQHRLRVEYYERSGGAQLRFHWSAAGAPCPAISAWRGEYWSNETLTGAPVRCRNDEKIDFNWGNGSPATDVPNDHFSARWTRTLNFSPGRYRFHLRGDDGVRLWVDDVLLIDEWREQPATEFTALRELSAGSHSLRVEYFERTAGATVELWWELAPDQAIVISDRPAFDTCYLPSPSQMAVWWGSSPYYEVNLYIGGANRGCESHNQQTLTAQWVNQVSSQGWNFIPTWVGPQAPCTNFRARMSYDTGVAYQQGRAEAEAAARAAQSLGLTTAGLGGTIIYYDMEPYGNNPDCRAAVNSFINGWVERLHELGNRAGAYGASCASNMSDWALLENAPDDIWPAHWVADHYSPNIRVWDVACIDNSLWSNHQRIRQYAGDHSESYGGVTLIIDSNIVDGHVAGENARPGAGDAQEAAQAAAGTVALPPAIRDLALLPSGQGWALVENRLLWTPDMGTTWREITPAGGVPRAAFFLDERQGWVALASAPDAMNRSQLLVAATQDGGQSWQTTPLTGFDPVDPNSTHAPLTIAFLDAQTGWIMVPLASSVNFSQAALLTTQDGGQSWRYYALPVAGTLAFVDAQHGWLLGDAAAGKSYRTQDGGASWQPVSLEALAAEGERLAYHPPRFQDMQTGVLPVTVTGAQGSAVRFFTTTDGGARWRLAVSVPLSGTAATVEAVEATLWLVTDLASGR
ncbi:MAG TPA: PA14 domain-containing protein, partial [Caldilineaceae bacterium]|nr:PA14 domain-containing protein [Caldilineaceae bacterium]